MKNRGEILVNKTLNRLALHEVLKKTVEVYAILTYYSSRSEHGRCNLGNPSHSIQEDASKERREVLSNVSDDIRPSKMIDIQSLVHMLLIL